MSRQPWHAINNGFHCRFFHANFPKILKRAILTENSSKAVLVFPLDNYVSFSGKKIKCFPESKLFTSALNSFWLLQEHIRNTFQIISVAIFWLRNILPSSFNRMQGPAMWFPSRTSVRALVWRYEGIDHIKV